MGLSIHTNASALVAQRSTSNASKSLQESMMRLSTGLRINSSKDDAAGVAISSRLSSLDRGLAQAERNVSDGLAVVSGLDGMASSVEDMLGRMKELAVQAQTETYNTADRTKMNLEYQALKDEIIAVGQRKINDRNMSAKGSFQIQTGAEAADSLAISITVAFTAASLASAATGFGALATAGSASVALAAIDVAIGKVASQRASFGAKMNRLEQISISLGNQRAGTQDVLGSIQDTDFAKETTNLTKMQIMQQASNAMLAQANQQGQAVLSLLG